MLIRSPAIIMIVTSSMVLATSQTLVTNKESIDRANTINGAPVEKRRDVKFTSGVDVQLIITELARDIDINVLFDRESADSLRYRMAVIDIKNVTSREALTYVILQEGLVAEDAGPRTILIGTRFKAQSLRGSGLRFTALNDELALYFGVDRGVLINSVDPTSPGGVAGLKAGDVIVGIDGVPVRGILNLIDLAEKKPGDLNLKIVRHRQEQTVKILRPVSSTP